MNGRTNVTTGANADDIVVPLDPVTNFTTESSQSKIFMTWTDPLDKYATPEGATAQDPQQLVSVWSHTIIVRKEGSDPVDQNDGVIVCSSSVRDQYKTSPFADTGVENGTEYHYGAFAINKNGIASAGAYQTIIPYPYDAILANNTWVQISDAGTSGVAQSLWDIGDEKEIRLNDIPYVVQIIDFNHDNLADGSGKAAITFGLKYLTDDTINPVIYATSRNKVWYNSSSMPSTVQQLTYDKMTEDLQSAIVSVTKATVNRITGYNYNHPDGQTHFLDNNSKDSGYGSLNSLTFLFSSIEVTGGTQYAQAGEGTQYEYFTTAANRIKALQSNNTTPVIWVLRSGNGSNTAPGTYAKYYVYLTQITASGGSEGCLGQTNLSDNYAQRNCNFCFGFCIGKSTA